MLLWRHEHQLTKRLWLRDCFIIAVTLTLATVCILFLWAVLYHEEAEPLQVGVWESSGVRPVVVVHASRSRGIYRHSKMVRGHIRQGGSAAVTGVAAVVRGPTKHVAAVPVVVPVKKKRGARKIAAGTQKSDKKINKSEKPKIVDTSKRKAVPEPVPPEPKRAPPVVVASPVKPIGTEAIGSNQDNHLELVQPAVEPGSDIFSLNDTGGSVEAPVYDEDVALVLAEVSHTWRPPGVDHAKPVRLAVQFDQKGAISDITFVEKTGIPAYDCAARMALLKAFDGVYPQVMAGRRCVFVF